jgi:hypothetical protein
MMRLLMILGLLFATAPLNAEVMHQEDGLPGNYSVGNWTGRCARDGWLNGADHEICGAHLKAFVSVDLRRNAKGLTVFLLNQGCPKETMYGRMSVKALATAGRAATLEALMQKLIKRQQKKCGMEGEMYPVEQADLADILTETDGLEF